MEAGAPLIHGVAPSRAVSLARRLATAPIAVAGIVALSSVVHAALAWRRATPGYFPDKHVLRARPLPPGERDAARARRDRPFPPSALSPVDRARVALGRRRGRLPDRPGVQHGGDVAGRDPVFLLARRLRVGDRLALAAAAVAVVLPELVYSSSVLAESLAYPLALTAVALAVAVIERPLLRLQLAFLACSGLAAFTRLQLAVLPLCYLLAILAVGLRERQLRLRLGGAVAVGATVAFLSGGLGVGLVGSLGVYGSLTAYSIEPGGAAKAFGERIRPRLCRRLGPGARRAAVSGWPWLALAAGVNSPLVSWPSRYWCRCSLRQRSSATSAACRSAT